MKLDYPLIFLGTVLSDEANETDLIRATTFHKKKRKKKSQPEEVQEKDEGKVTLSDTEERMKQLKVSDHETESPKTASKSSKRKKKRGTEKSSPLKDLCNAMAADSADEMDVSTPVKKRKHRKKKHLDDIESTACDDHLERTIQLYSEEIVDGIELGRRSEVVVSLSEGEGGSQEDIMDTQTIEVTEGDEAVPLMLLGHAGEMAKEKKTVQRQLPQWIIEADIIPDDIAEQSR